MGPNGGSGGCWCMLWRMSAKAHKAATGEGTRQAIRARVEAGPPPGLVAFRAGVPAGWISVAPRAEFPRLGGSRVLAPVDGQPVWSVSCFLVTRPQRGQGVAGALLAAACDFAAAQGAEILEGYPIDPGETRYAPSFAWTGLATLFAGAGFAEVARRSPRRPIYRKRLGPTGAVLAGSPA